MAEQHILAVAVDERAPAEPPDERTPTVAPSTVAIDADHDDRPQLQVRAPVVPWLARNDARAQRRRRSRSVSSEGIGMHIAPRNARTKSAA